MSVLREYNLRANAETVARPLPTHPENLLDKMEKLYAILLIHSAGRKLPDIMEWTSRCRARSSARIKALPRTKRARVIKTQDSAT